MNYILGINSGIGKHDGAAALLKDGKVVAMAEQERFSRRKHAFSEPATNAIKYCLDVMQIKLEDLSAIAFGWDEPLFSTLYGQSFDESVFLEKLFPKDIFGHSHYPTVCYIPHHIAHAASAFWMSGFEETAILVVDGHGEAYSTTLAYGKEQEITVIKQFDTCKSLGNFYAFASDWAALSFWDAGKLMGLASYGKPNCFMPLVSVEDGYDFVNMGTTPQDIKDHDSFQSHYIQKYFREVFPYESGIRSEPMAYANLAASVQRALEEACVNLAVYLRQFTTCENLVLSGGVALNCTMNAQLAEKKIFKNTFFQPIAYDAGVSLGAALAVWHKHSTREYQHTSQMSHVYWGPSYTSEEIMEALHQQDVSYRRLQEDELVQYIAECIHKHQIIGWFQGKAEIGPRALGARSILGNPCRRANLTKINQLKGREVWRPLAPSILEEYFSTFFDASLPSPYMNISALVREDVRKIIPAVVHVDGTARPQAVSYATNPRYWNLIEHFRLLTNVPVIINTSFNLAGEPIVNTPQEAINDFLRSELDVLALGDFVITKSSHSS